MLERLNEALDLVESCLTRGEDVEVSAVARAAATSEHHFRRMFSTLAGMSVSEYVRRRRLTLAASDVLSDELSLLDVAVRHGYGSTEAFNRAFRAMHGAGQARRRGGALVSQPRISFHLVGEGRTSMRYRIVEKPSFRVVGRKARVPLVHRGPNQAIIDFVKGLEPAVREQIAALSDEEPVGTVAVTDAIDESRRRELDYWHGAVTSGEVPPGLKSLDVPAGTWRAYSPSEACRVHIDRSQFEHRLGARQPPCRHEPIDSAGRIRYEGDSASLT